MMINLTTPNGTMAINANVFFPVGKKEMKKLRKITDYDEGNLKAVIYAIDCMIDAMDTFRNDAKARKEIHAASLLECIRGSFQYEAEQRRTEFYAEEENKAYKCKCKLESNREELLS